MRSKHRKSIGRALWWIVAAFGAFIVAPVISEFFISLAEEAGLYETPSEKVVGLMEWLAGFVYHPVFLFLAVFVFGLAVGYWLDGKLRRIELGEGAVITLRFYGEKRAPFHAHKKNIFRCYVEERHPDWWKEEHGPYWETWVFILFDKQLKPGQTIVGSDDIKLPPHEVKFFNERATVIVFSGLLPKGTVKIKVTVKE